MDAVDEVDAQSAGLRSYGEGGVSLQTLAQMGYVDGTRFVRKSDQEIFTMELPAGGGVVLKPVIPVGEEEDGEEDAARSPAKPAAKSPAKPAAKSPAKPLQSPAKSPAKHDTSRAESPSKGTQVDASRSAKRRRVTGKAADGRLVISYTKLVSEYEASV